MPIDTQGNQWSPAITPSLKSAFQAFRLNTAMAQIGSRSLGELASRLADNNHIAVGDVICPGCHLIMTLAPGCWQNAGIRRDILVRADIDQQGRAGQAD